MTNWFMNLFMDVFFNSEFSHWVWSIVMGVTDVINVFIERLTGLARVTVTPEPMFCGRANL